MKANEEKISHSLGIDWMDAFYQFHNKGILESDNGSLYLGLADKQQSRSYIYVSRQMEGTQRDPDLGALQHCIMFVKEGWQSMIRKTFFWGRHANMAWAPTRGTILMSQAPWRQSWSAVWGVPGGKEKRNPPKSGNSGNSWTTGFDLNPRETPTQGWLIMRS